MNFEITNELIDTIKPYTENATVTISTDNKDWKGRDYKSDFVTIDEKNNVGFEVFDNEIIVFYFTDRNTSAVVGSDTSVVMQSVWKKDNNRISGTFLKAGETVFIASQTPLDAVGDCEIAVAFEKQGYTVYRITSSGEGYTVEEKTAIPGHI